MISTTPVTGWFRLFSGRSLRHLLLILGGLLLLGGQATQSAPPAGLRVVESRPTGLIVELNTPDYELLPSAAGAGFQRVGVSDPSFGFTGAPGEARLPTKSILIGIPPDAQVSLRLLEDAGGFARHGLRLEPVPLEQPELTPSFAADPEAALALANPMDAYDGTKQVYASSATAAKKYVPVLLGETGYLRDQRFVRVTFQPFEYRTNQELWVHQRLRVEIEFRTPTGNASAFSASSTPRPDPYFEPVLQRALINYDQARAWRTAAQVSASPARSQGDLDVTALTSGQGLPPQRLRIHTDQAGLYVITYDDIAATGANLAKIVPRTLRLESQGVERAILVQGEADGQLNPGDAILFYGQGSASRYSRENVYWLSWGAEDGLRMAARNVEPGRGGDPAAGYRQTDHIEQNTTYLSSVPPTGQADRWYGDRYQVGGRNPIDTLTYTVPITTPLPGQTATLRVAARGFTTWFDVYPDHHLRFYVNDQQVGDGFWDGQDQLDNTVSFSSDLLHEGDNVIKLFAPDDTGASTDVGYANFLDFTYPRRLQAVDNRLFFAREHAGRSLFEVSDFTAEPVEAYDISNPAQPVRLEGGVLSGGVFAFSDESPAATGYLAQTLARRLHPLHIAGDVATTYRSPDNQADYLIISHADFLDAIAPLGAYRQSQGMRVLIIDVQDLYDEFSYGEATPEAIRDFLDYAFHNWQAPAPAYVLLVGDGTYDPLDYKASGRKNYIPPLLALVDPFLKETATDNRLVTVSGADALPDLYIGRFPANSAAEVTTMVNKTLQYETQPWPGDWKNRILFVADNADTAGDFAYLSDQVADHLPSGVYNDQKQKIYLGVTHTSSVAARADIITAFNNGLFLSNYTGHGQVQHWASEFILRVEDSSNLINGRRLPVHLSMTCLDGRFHEIGSDAQAEVLVRNPSGGAVAVWAATGLGVAHGHDLMHRGFYSALFDDDQGDRLTGVELGVLVEAGKLELYTGDTLGIFQDLLDTFAVMGDPALRLKVASTDLAIEPVDAPSQPLAPGDVLTLHYRVRNLGQMPAPNVVVSVSLPQLDDLAAASDLGPVAIEPGSPARFTLGRLEPGAAVELTITGALAEGLTAAEFSISAETSADWQDGNPANNVSPQVLIHIIGLDASEPNDSRASATLLPIPGRLSERSHYPANDQDWFVFQAEIGVSYRFFTDQLSAGGDTLLILYDAAGNELLRSDDAGPGAPWSALDWQAPSSGPYYLMVTDPEGVDTTGSFIYDLVASRDFQHFLPMLRLDKDKPLVTPTPTPQPPSPTPTSSPTPVSTPTPTPHTPTPTPTPSPTATPPGEVCLPSFHTILPLSGAPKALIATGNRVLAGLYDVDAVAVVDGQTQDLLGSHASGGSMPNGLAVWNSRYYVSHRNNNLVSIFDLATDALLTRFEVDAMPWGLAIGPDNLLYVANFDSDTVTLHDPVSGALMNTASVSGSPSLVLSFNGRVWVTRQEGNTGLVSLTAGGDIVTLVPGVPAGAKHMAVDGRSGLIYISHPALKRIYVVDSNLGKVVATFHAPGAPYALAVNTATNQLYAVDAGRSLLYILDLKDGAFLGQISIGQQSVEHGGQGLALLNGQLYVANDAERTITVFDAGSCSS